MEKQKMVVKGLSITIEKLQKGDYISLTDIAKQSEKSKPDFLIASWMKNRNTLEYLETWEEIHNPDFKSYQMVGLWKEYTSNRSVLTPKKWIDDTGAIGLKSKRGKGGGTFGHSDIAFNFCLWLSPSFQLYVAKEFQRLKEIEFSRESIEWHISRITDNVDEIRFLLDTIPGQKPDRNRLNKNKQ